MQSKEIQKLCEQAQVCGLQHNHHIPEELRKRINIADTSKQQLCPDDVNQICRWSGTDPSAIAALQEAAEHLVNQTKTQLIKNHPELILPGGGLHPEQRAEACWRDCWNFLRVCIYAVASSCPHCTDDEGMKAVRALYAFMSVPMDGMNLALETLEELCKTRLDATSNRKEAECAQQAFQHMREQLNQTSMNSC